MSITATFYSFSKKKNSTKLPTGGTNYNILVKEPCSVIKPTIKLDISNPTAFNYVHIPSFGNRYYYINDWVSDHGMWIADCIVDVLATYRSDILNSSQYVLRSASDTDPYIENADYIVTDDFERSSEWLQNSPFGGLWGSQSHVLAVSNNYNSYKLGGLQYLFLDQDQMRWFMHEVLSDTGNYGWGPTEASFGLTDAVARSIVNPLQYVGDSYTLPFAPTLTNLLHNVDSLHLGSWNMGTYTGANSLKAFIPAGKDATCFTHTMQLSLAQHPLANSHGRWLNAYPYTTYRLFAGPFGIVDIDITPLISVLASDGSAYTINCVVECDVFGKARLSIQTGVSSTPPGVVLAKAYADLKVPFSLTQQSDNKFSFFSDMLGTVASIWSGNYVGAAQQTGNMINTLDRLFPKPETKGITGSTLCNVETWHLETTHRVISTQHKYTTGNVAQVTTNLTGAPLCEVTQLSNLSGFCLCDSHIWLDIDGYSDEYEIIYQYMTGGFFIE